MVRWLTRLWSRVTGGTEPSISTQFLIASSIVLCVTMAVLGTWMNNQVKQSVLVTFGAQATNFMTGFLEPRVQKLLPDGTLPAEDQLLLDQLFIGTPLGNTLVSIKIWSADGTVLYGTTKELIGQNFVSSDVAQAATGRIVAEYEDLTSLESAYEQGLNMALIEVYAPLFDVATREVVAVGEIYENADALAAELLRSQVTTWIVVALTTLFMLAVLYLIVRRGASTIARQRTELRQQFYEAQRLAQQNAELRVVADRSRRSASEANEQFLGRLGSDIHDGPIQLLTLAMLRLTSVIRGLKTRRTTTPPVDEIEASITITQDALTELRNISTGLSLPEIAPLSLDETVRLAIFRHEDISGEKVNYTPSPLPQSVNEALKICVYRVIQEGLTNASKHAPGAVKQVTAAVHGSDLVVEVIDEGPGLPQSQTPPQGGRSHLGLAGIRNRVGALKGSVDIVSEAGHGTRIIAHLPLED